MRLHDYLEWRARQTPRLDFAIFEGRRISYADADAQANRIARAFIAAGLGVGDRIAILSKNCIEFALLYFAASKAGVVPVPLNYRLAPPEWTYILKDSGAVLLIARGEFVATIDAVRDQLDRVKRYIAVDSEVPGWESFDDFVGDHPATPPEREISPDGDLYQMYTSGTTGRPKGTVLSQRAVCTNVHQASTAFGSNLGDRVLVVAPLYHAAAGIVTFITIQGGGTLFIQEDFDPAEVVRALSEENIAVALLVPVMIQFCMLAVPDIAERRFDDLRLIVYGASAIAEQTLRRAIDIFGCDFIQAYGMTETTAVATHLSAEDHRRALESQPDLLLSAGRPVVGTEIRVVDVEDRPVAPGEIGQIVVRGSQLMRGYWNLPEATEEALRGGWMHTGDAGILDERGYLYVQDRVNDMIVSGGENVYPREIEDVLFRHEAIADAAAIGVPDEQWGEVVKAIVVLREGAPIGPDEIIEFCRGQLAGYKRPRSVEIVSALPRNPTGKVLKRELREPYWKGRQRRVN